MSTIIMRCPTQEEYYQLCKVTQERDELMHWQNALSWVDIEAKAGGSDSVGVVCGRDSPLHHYTGLITSRDSVSGFRPAVEDPDPDYLVPDKNGSVILGTLYMNGRPVRVPSVPAFEGNITPFIPGTWLEMRPPLEDPAYQVRGFKVSDTTYVADRVMLIYISYNDIMVNAAGTPVWELPFGDGTLKIFACGPKYAMYIQDPDGTSHVMDLYASPKKFGRSVIRNYTAEIVTEDRGGSELILPQRLLAPGDIDPVIQLPDGRLYCRKCKVYVENTANAEMRRKGAFAHSHVCE